MSGAGLTSPVRMLEGMVGSRAPGAPLLVPPHDIVQNDGLVQIMTRLVLLLKWKQKAE
jgi:hypothetical protein